MVQGLFLEYAIMRSKRSSNRLVAPFREINKEREKKDDSILLLFPR